MGKYGCSICDDKAASQVINEELGKGATFAFISRLMTLRGFPIGPEVVSEHKRHSIITPVGIAKRKRDVAIMVADRVADLLEQTDAEGEPRLDLTNKDHVPGILAGLRAQTEINKQVNRSDDRKTAVALAMLFSGASQEVPAHALLDDGKTIEGDYEEIDADIIALTADPVSE